MLLNGERKEGKGKNGWKRKKKKEEQKEKNS